MRPFAIVVVLVGVLTASIGVANGSRTPAVRDARVQYLFKAVLLFTYDVEWVQASGDRYGDCTAWGLDRGSTETVGTSSAFTTGGPTTLAGRIVIYPRIAKDRTQRFNWADGTAVGPARISVRRRLDQTGGTTACGDQAAKSDPVPSNDCGLRTYKTRSAVLMPQVVGSNYLDELQRSVGPNAAQGLRVLSVSAAPPTILYRQCKTTGDASEIPALLPIVVRASDVTALQRLKPSKRLTIRSNRSGECTRELPQEATCRYTVDARLVIQRWAPGIKFP